MEPVKIFIASPSDVAEERSLAYRAIERLRREFADRAEIQAMIWEHEPLYATSDFQSQIGTPATSDIFVLMLWARFGSPLGANFVRADGSAYASATEYEFEEAINAFRSKGSPKMLVYRKTAPAVLADEQARAQSAAVDRFFDHWFINPEDKTAKAAYHTFTEPSRFEDILEIHLRKSLQEYLPNPSNLPASVNAFVGREELSAKIGELLSSEETRLVTLVGPGGTGKTRLSMHVGRELLPQFNDGVFFVSLASVTDPDLVPSAIATTLGIKESDEPGAASVIRELKRKQMLLLIDNLEQVQSAEKYLSDILTECHYVKAIVTSREALRVNGARTVRVPPLELPNLDALPPLDEIREFESVRLFVARAHAVRDDFELTDQNARSVVEICRRVDALPLAIELAASRVRTMSPERLSQALNKRFKVLTGGSADLLDHQKSLRGLIAWSYDLLDESEQILWRRLAVFADGCSIETAQEVCDPDDEYFIEVDVESLVDKSLVNMQIDEDSTLSRITMLESLREFARDQLVESPEFDLIQERFCTWSAGIGFIDEETAMGPDFQEHLNLLDTEQNNLRSVLEYCSTDSHAEIALRICGGLYQYWFTRGLYIEGTRWIEKSLGLNSGDVTAIRGRALKGLSTLLREQHRLDDAADHANQALKIYADLNDNKMRASILCELGVIAQRAGDFDRASGYLDECITLARAEGAADHNMSFFLIVKGISEHLKGDLTAAKESYVEGLNIAQDAGDKTRTANALINLGEIKEAEGQPDEAYSYYRESLKVWKELKHKAAIAACAEWIAGLEVRFRARPSEAAFLFGAAEAIREAIDVPVEPFNMERQQDDITQAREAISQDDFDLAWHAGRELGIDGVLRHVLGDGLSEPQQAEH
jgi:non-specific serine/threonine protein kinase